MPLKSARAFFDVSEKARRILELYFQLKTPLYFSYSHLVCRSAIDGTPSALVRTSHSTRSSVRCLNTHTHTCTCMDTATPHPLAVLPFQTQFPPFHGVFHEWSMSAVTGSEKQEARTDLSHPVHADNCLLVSEMNECIKEPPAYTHRDYR